MLPYSWMCCCCVHYCALQHCSKSQSHTRLFRRHFLLWKQINQTDGPSLLSEIQVQSRPDSTWWTLFWWHTAVLPIQSSTEPNYLNISSHPGYKLMTSRQSPLWNEVPTGSIWKKKSFPMNFIKMGNFFLAVGRTGCLLIFFKEFTKTNWIRLCLWVPLGVTGDF